MPVLTGLTSSTTPTSRQSLTATWPPPAHADLYHPQFGGFASNLALVVELEEKAPVSEITIAQNQGSGGAFTVSVANEPDPDAGVVITEGSFTGPEYTVDAHNSDGEPIEARYVIINFTELPTLSNTNSPERPYGLRIAEIDVN